MRVSLELGNIRTGTNIAHVDDVLAHFAGRPAKGYEIIKRELGDEFKAHHFPSAVGLMKLASEEGLDRDFGAGIVFQERGQRRRKCGWKIASGDSP